MGAPKRTDRLDRQTILTAMGDSPVSVTALAAELGVTRQAVQYHLRLLREAGLVDKSERGPHSRWTQTRSANHGNLVSST